MCNGESDIDLALNKLYNVPLAPDGVAGCWKGQDVPCGGLPRSGFTFLVIHSNMFKGMALAAPPGSVVRPDVSDKSMCPKDPDFLPETGPDDYYQERVLHYAVMGTDEYIYVSMLLSRFVALSISLTLKAYHYCSSALGVVLCTALGRRWRTTSCSRRC